MPAATADVIAELDRVLRPQDFEDYCFNGLQVPGASLVSRLATGVSASAELFALAEQSGAQMLLVHHGLFWGSGVRHLDELLGGRLRTLLGANIALAAYHLPLDAHAELGNNAILARRLAGQQLRALTPFGEHRGRAVGWLAALGGDGVRATELFARAAQATGSDPLVFDAGPEQVRSVALVTGAGADYLAEAAAAGADALVTGEASERTMALARETGVHLVAAGHYATETFGVRALGEHLAARFGLDHVFLDVPNPV